jgi:hypothetical protein
MLQLPLYSLFTQCTLVLYLVEGDAELSAKPKRSARPGWEARYGGGVVVAHAGRQTGADCPTPTLDVGMRHRQRQPASGRGGRAGLVGQRVPMLDRVAQIFALAVVKEARCRVVAL